jgi:putative cardiolipin synthase
MLARRDGLPPGQRPALQTTPGGVRKEEGGKRNVRIAACGRLCVVDDDLAVIGSYNMDPRSNLWNSEIALVIYGEEFGRKVLAEMNEEFSSENAFRVGLGDDGDVIWRLSCEGCQDIWTQEPDSTWWKRFSSTLISIVPIESEL